MSDTLAFSDGTIIENSNDAFIIMAEDDPDDQDFFIEALYQEAKQIKILAVNNGARTLEILNSLPAGKLPLLIIMDYNLPQLDGSHLLKALHLNKRFAAVPKIIWSTSTSGVFEKQCLELGANAYLVKPGTVQGFRELIQHILRLCTTRTR